MTITNFKILTVLAEEKNMRKAAERLFVSQPALSQRLRNIEKQWGTKLFIRSQKGLMLTPSGEIVVKYAQEMLEKQEKVREEIQALDIAVHGTLKIACASIVGQNWLPKVLKQFVDLYPHVKISLMTGWSSEILKALYEGEVHIGITRGATDWKGTKFHLFKDSLSLVDREIERVEEVLDTDRPFIQFKSDSNYYREIQDWWYKQFQTVPKRTIVVDQIETCKQMAYNGIGYAILPNITLNGPEENIFKVPLLDDEGNPLKRDAWLLGYESVFELRQVQAFLDVVRKYIEANKEHTI